MKIPGGERILRSVCLFLLSTGLWAAGFFITPLLQIAQAVSAGDLLIEAVQITGGTGLTDNDFVRIYNRTSAAIDLNGLRLVKRTKTGTTDTTIRSWTSPLLLNPGVVYTWANSSNGYAASIHADTSSTATLSNDNAIAIRNGVENNSEIIDAVGWGTAANALVETASFAQNPGANEYIERINYQDTDNNSLDFQLVTPVTGSVCGNGVMEQGENCDDENTVNNDGCSSECLLEVQAAVCGNGVIESGELCDDNNTVSEDGCSSTCQIETPALTGPVYINEFIPDPVSGGNEWIELYSPTDTAYSITNWTLEDGAGTKTKLTGTIGGSSHFFAIPKSSGSLNNSGDIIILRNAEGTIIQSVAYGDWDDGNVSDNAPTASDPYSIVRLPNAIDDASDNDNYAVTSTLTMLAVNIITEPETLETESEDENNDTEYDYSKTITLSEIAPNPAGIDSEHKNDEFIELYNFGVETVRLEGWRIEIGDKQYIYEFPKTSELKAAAFMVIRASSGFSLANSGATVKLFQPTRATAYQTTTYKEANEGQNWVLASSTHYINNIWKWSFTSTPGAVNVIASAPVASFSIGGDLVINKALRFDSSDSDAAGASYAWDFGDKTTSTHPNPEHAYSSAGSFNVVLTLKNAYGTSTVNKKITIAKNDLSAASLQGGPATSEDMPQLKIVSIFPNPTGADGNKEWIEITNDEVTSVNLEGWRISSKSKKGPVIDASLEIAAEDRLKITAKFLPTLGNTSETLSLLAPDGTIVDSVSYTDAKEDQLYVLTNGAWKRANIGNESDSTAMATHSQTTPNNNTKQSISGLVAALPGMFSTQYFYIKLDAQELLYQVYNSKKLFPKLKMGQYISVTGEQSVVAAGPRLKTATAADIMVGAEGNLAEPTISTAVAVREAPHPRIAKVEGEVTSKKSPRLILTDATGDVEIYLAKGSGLSVTAYALGDKLSVSGITQIDGEKVRLMPRSEADIIFANAPTGPTASANPEMIADDFQANERNAKKSLLPYLILVAFAVTGAGGYLFWKFLK